MVQAWWLFCNLRLSRPAPPFRCIHVLDMRRGGFRLFQVGGCWLTGLLLRSRWRDLDCRQIGLRVALFYIAGRAIMMMDWRFHAGFLLSSGGGCNRPYQIVNSIISFTSLLSISRFVYDLLLKIIYSICNVCFISKSDARCSF